MLKLGDKINDREKMRRQREHYDQNRKTRQLNRDCA
jgi:hypothetical protein